MMYLSIALQMLSLSFFITYPSILLGLPDQFCIPLYTNIENFQECFCNFVRMVLFCIHLCLKIENNVTLRRIFPTGLTLLARTSLFFKNYSRPSSVYPLIWLKYLQHWKSYPSTSLNLLGQFCIPLDKSIENFQGYFCNFVHMDLLCIHRYLG